jgi:hypothetical protein
VIVIGFELDLELLGRIQLASASMVPRAEEPHHNQGFGEYGTFRVASASVACCHPTDQRRGAHNMLEVIRQVLEWLLKQPLFLGMVMPLIQPIAVLGLRRLARRSGIELQDWAISHDLLVSAIAIWLAAMASFGAKASGLQQANLGLAFVMVLSMGWLAVALSLGIRLWGLMPDGETPTLPAIAISAGLSIVALSGSYLLVLAASGS